MNNIFTKKIAECVAQYCGLTAEEIAGLIEVPADEQHGDYALPCFGLAKKLKKAPVAIAKDLAENCSFEGVAEKVASVGAYLNIFMKREEFSRHFLRNVFEEGRTYGNAEAGKGKIILIDFSSPNIAKHLAFHHIRSAVIGQSLRNILSALGYECVGINFLGDWGTQFGMLISAIKKYCPDGDLGGNPITKLNELYVQYHKEMEEKPELEQEGRDWFRKLETGDSEARTLWQKIYELSIEEFKKIYGILNVEFDVFTGESKYALDGSADGLVDSAVEKGVAKESEGALVIDMEEEGIPPCIIRKSDGTTLYEVRDMCAGIDRFNTYKFDKMLYVVDMGQSLHFKQVFKSLKLLGYEWVDRCVHVKFGLVRFSGKKARTREGNVVLLEDVLEEAYRTVLKNVEEINPELDNKEEVARKVSVGAIIFADLFKGRNNDVDFNWDEMLNFNSFTAPYIQYTNARAKSIMRKSGRKSGESVAPDADFSALSSEEEWRLVKLIERFPSAVLKAGEEYEPCGIAGYMFELCNAFNNYYQKGAKKPELKVLCDDKVTRKARLLLTQCVSTVLTNGLSLLNIPVLEKM